MRKLLNTFQVTCRFPLVLAMLTLMVVLFATELLASGHYRIVHDENGIVFQTEDDGSWYIPEEDQRYFVPGQTGRYRILWDDNGRYFETKKGKFYIGDNEDQGLDKGFDNPDTTHGRNVVSGCETEVQVVGSHVIVPVQIRHRGRSLDLKLLLDTGASMITLHKSAVNRLRFSKQQTAHFIAADGSAIPADLVKLDEVRFGPYNRKKILAGIIDHRQEGKPIYDGLLGMNALQSTNYKVDYKKGTIKWLDD